MGMFFGNAWFSHIRDIEDIVIGYLNRLNIKWALKSICAVLSSGWGLIEIRIF